MPPLLEIVTPVPAGNAAFRNKPVKATVPGATDRRRIADHAGGPDQIQVAAR